MKKFLSVFVKTAAVIASVAGIAYVVKQVLDKKAEDDLFDDFDEDFEDDFAEEDDDEAEEETAESERGYVDINIASAAKGDEAEETPAPAAE